MKKLVIHQKDEIVSIEFLDYDDDEGYVDYGVEMLNYIKSSPYTYSEYDAISGATFTTEAVINAYLSALSKAINR